MPITDTSKKVRKITVDNETMELKTSNGLPAGGTTDQVLAKASDADYDTKWVDTPSGGEKLYYHNVSIKLITGTIRLSVPLITKSPDIFTFDTLRAKIYELTQDDYKALLPVAGSISLPGKICVLSGIYADSTSYITYYYREYEQTIVDGVIQTTYSGHSAGVTTTNELRIVDKVSEV